MAAFPSSIHEIISSGSQTLTAIAILLPLKENHSLINPQGHSKKKIPFVVLYSKKNPWNILAITETEQHWGSQNHVGILSSRLVEHQGGKTFNKFYSYLELCIASISFSTVFLRTGIEETVSMVFSPYNFTFTVLFCKQTIKKKEKRKKKEKSYVPRNLTSPLRRIREHREKLTLPSFLDFCLCEN